MPISCFSQKDEQHETNNICRDLQTFAAYGDINLWLVSLPVLQAVSIQRGYASDPETRFKAAAAGGLTTLAMHLIDSKQAGNPIHMAILLVDRLTCWFWRLNHVFKKMLKTGF